MNERVKNRKWDGVQQKKGPSTGEEPYYLKNVMPAWNGFGMFSQ